MMRSFHSVWQSPGPALVGNCQVPFYHFGKLLSRFFNLQVVVEPSPLFPAFETFDTEKEKTFF
jgi:hypothetical protein